MYKIYIHIWHLHKWNTNLSLFEASASLSSRSFNGWKYNGNEKGRAYNLIWDILFSHDLTSELVPPCRDEKSSPNGKGTTFLPSRFKRKTVVPVISLKGIHRQSLHILLWSSYTYLSFYTYLSSPSPKSSLPRPNPKEVPNPKVQLGLGWHHNHKTTIDSGSYTIDSGSHP